MFDETTNQTKGNIMSIDAAGVVEIILEKLEEKVAQLTSANREKYQLRTQLETITKNNGTNYKNLLAERQRNGEILDEIFKILDESEDEDIRDDLKKLLSNNEY